MWGMLWMLGSFDMCNLMLRLNVCIIKFMNVCIIKFMYVCRCKIFSVLRCWEWMLESFDSCNIMLRMNVENVRKECGEC